MQKRELILYYLIKRFYEIYKRPLEGRKKLQKLIFLVEHFDLDTSRIVPSSGITGYKFKIWYYGPYSSDLKKDTEDLVENGLLNEDVKYLDDFLYTDESPKRLYLYSPKTEIRVENELDKQTIEKIDKILKEFGTKSPYELEKKVSDLLNLDPLKKLKVWGKSLDEYLSSSDTN